MKLYTISLVMSLFLTTASIGMKEPRAGKGSGSRQRRKQKLSKKYNYLVSAPFRERLVLAAKWTDDCDVIVEIGGGDAPLSAVVTDHREVIVIDPVVKKIRDDKKHHIRKAFQHWSGEDMLKDKKYAVVLLGLELAMPPSGWNKLYDLINNAHKTVIEHSTTYKKAKKQFQNICESTTTYVVMEKEFDFSKEDWTEFVSVHPFRKMSLLQAKES